MYVYNNIYGGISWCAWKEKIIYTPFPLSLLSSNLYFNDSVYFLKPSPTPPTKQIDTNGMWKTTFFFLIVSRPPPTRLPRQRNPYCHTIHWQKFYTRINHQDRRSSTGITTHCVYFCAILQPDTPSYRPRHCE